VLLIYQKGIQQGNPDVASALGVILVIVVLIVGLANLWLNERGTK
jgi:multiple sugar transport system permease protein